MDFLVHSTAQLPQLSGEELDGLTAAERDRGRVLVDEGILRAIWRLPGQQANIAIYSVDDATHLHDVLSTLPFASWTTHDVSALARHPVSAPGSSPFPADSEVTS